MGTGYNLHCLDCNSTEKLSANFDPIRIHYVRPILEHATAIARLAPAFESNSDWTLQMSGVWVPVIWLAQHAGHRLRPITDYGQIDGTCGKEIRCKACNEHRYGNWCGLEPGHVGECKGR